MILRVLSDVSDNAAQDLTVGEINNARGCPDGAVLAVLGKRCPVLHDGIFQQLVFGIVAGPRGAGEMDLRAPGAVARAEEFMGISACRYQPPCHHSRLKVQVIEEVGKYPDFDFGSAVPPARNASSAYFSLIVNLPSKVTQW